MNADGYVSTGSGVLDTNMFAYCGNNPVNMTDKNGKSFALAGGLTFGWSNFWNPVGWIALAGAAALTAGYSIYKTATASKTKSTSKAETKEKSIPYAPPKTPVYIYRFGGTNPGNLTPRLKDKSTGLSFSTIPKPGCAVTTIEQLNATGIVYAIQDKPGHVGVWPIGGTMEDWINEGSSSKWTIAVKSVVVKWDGGN